MAGFDKAKARGAFDIPDDLDIIKVITVGYPNEVAALPETLRDQEHPQKRMSKDNFLV